MIRVQQENFSVEAELDDLKIRAGDVGAIVTFTGLVREFAQDTSVRSMVLEHYPGMTEKALHKIADSAAQRWSLAASTIIHRVGELKAGDQIVVVATASRHRKDAFEAAQYIMDYLKNEAPFWKKERTGDGERWVEQHGKDIEAMKRWS